MFAKQQILMNHISSIKEWVNKYQLSNDLTELEKHIHHFQVRLPLVGAFSAGKSSLINALIGEKLLSLDITPETGIATELYYQEKEEIVAYHPDGRQAVLSREDLAGQAISEFAPEGWIEAGIHAEILKNYPHIRLVDLPGLSSGIDIHSKAIDQYMSRSLAYCIVVSVEDGEISQTTANFLCELSLFDKPIILVLSKSDKRALEDLPAIQKQIESSIERILNRKPICTIIVSAKRKKEELQQNMKSSLQILEGRSEQSFNQHIVGSILAVLENINQQIKILANQDDLNSEQLAAKKETMQNEMAAFQQQLMRQTKHLEADISHITHLISTHIENRLLGQRDSFARALLSNSDMNPMLTQAVRLAATEAIQREFIPRVQRYIKNIESELPVQIQAGTQFDLNEVGGGNFSLSAIGFSLVPVLTQMLPNLLRFLGPYGQAASVIISGLAGLFLSNRQKEEERLQRLETAKTIVAEQLIPQAVSQVNTILPNFLETQIAAARSHIQTAAQSRFDELQHTLNTLAQQLQQNEYRQDLSNVKQLIDTLKA